MSEKAIEHARYTSGDVARIAGVSLRQLQWWDERNVVSPRQEGHRRVYLPREVVEVSVIAELRRKGLSLQKLRRAMRFMNRNDFAKARYLVTDGAKFYLVHYAEAAIDVMEKSTLPMCLVAIPDQ